jgi:hypothetical protein
LKSNGAFRSWRCWLALNGLRVAKEPSAPRRLTAQFAPLEAA